MIKVNKIKNIVPGEKIYVIFSIMITLGLILGPTLTKSYAAEDSSVEWQLLYIKKDTCGPKDNMDKVYASLTSKYFEFYQLENNNYSVNCISESQFKDFQKSENVNLLILNFDYDKCNEFKIIVRADSSTKNYVMMAPYEPAIGNALINYAITNSNSELINLQRDLTKMWI